MIILIAYMDTLSHKATTNLVHITENGHFCGLLLYTNISQPDLCFPYNSETKTYI